MGTMASRAAERCPGLGPVADPTITAYRRRERSDMLVIASNITTRSRKVSEALRPWLAELENETRQEIEKEHADTMRDLARQCVSAGADIIDINLQQRYDRPEVMSFMVEVVQPEIGGRQLCLSANRADTLGAGLKVCRRPPLVNYVSLEEWRLQEVLPLVVRYNADVILLTTDPTITTSAEEILKTAGILVGAANEAGIANGHIYIDPGVLHVTRQFGQEHTQALIDLLPLLAGSFDPPVKTTLWINNVSAAAPRRFRAPLNGTFLAMLGGLGLSSAFMDVLDKETMRTLRILKILRNEIIYADGELELATAADR